jgi:hypothetical protein
MCVCVCVFVYTGLQQVVSASEVPHTTTAVSIRRLFYEHPSRTLYFTGKKKTFQITHLKNLLLTLRWETTDQSLATAITNIFATMHRTDMQPT